MLADHGGPTTCQIGSVLVTDVNFPGLWPSVTCSHAEEYIESDFGLFLDPAFKIYVRSRSWGCN